MVIMMWLTARDVKDNIRRQELFLLSCGGVKKRARPLFSQCQTTCKHPSKPTAPLFPVSLAPVPHDILAEEPEEMNSGFRPSGGQNTPCATCARPPDVSRVALASCCRAAEGGRQSQTPTALTAGLSVCAKSLEKS